MTNRYFKTPFAANGEKVEIAELAQVDGTVSYQEGYSPDYAKNQEDVGAKFLERDQMNGLFHEITSNLKQWQEQGLYPYNPDIAYSIGGRCSYDDGSGAKAYISTIGNNTGVPSIGGKVQNGWQLNDIKAAMEQFGMFGNSIYLGDTLNPNLKLDDITYNSLIHYYRLTTSGSENVPWATSSFWVFTINHGHPGDSSSYAVQIAFRNTNYSSAAIRCRRNSIWDKWQSLGNKGVNLDSPINLSWNTGYTAPVNGTIWGYGMSDTPGQYLAVYTGSNQAMSCIIAAVPGNGLAVHYPVRAGQTV